MAALKRRLAVSLLALRVLAAPGWAADIPLQFGAPALLTNRELRLPLSAAPTGFCRVEFSADLASWSALATLSTSTGAVQWTDSATPLLTTRFYRAETLEGTNVFAGDHLATTHGDVVLHPVYHASLVLQWDGLTLYVDPADVASRFNGLPRADLVLLTHGHSDHYTSGVLTAVLGTNAVVVAPPSVHTSMPTTLKNLTTALGNGASTNLLGIGIEAIPAYNLSTTHHPKGTGNGYVLTLGGQRVYVTGDTEDIPELRALRNIDVAFVCMNLPYTMTVEKAVSAVREFHPRIVYPYHYSIESNATRFKQQMAVEPTVEVRLRKWY